MNNFELNQIRILITLYRLNSIWCLFSRKSINTIKIWVYLTKFVKIDISLCKQLGKKVQGKNIVRKLSIKTVTSAITEMIQLSNQSACSSVHEK